MLLNSGETASARRTLYDPVIRAIRHGLGLDPLRHETELASGNI